MINKEDIPTKEYITIVVEQEPISHIRVIWQGRTIGLVRRLKDGHTFTSDEVGSFKLSNDTQIEDLPEIVAEFFKSRADRWVEFNKEDDEENV